MSKRSFRSSKSRIMIGLRRGSRAHNRNMLLYQGVLIILGAIMAVVMWGYRSQSLDLVYVVLIVSGALTMFVVARSDGQLSNLTASLVFAANLLPVYWILWASQTV